ncbi:hypothetical protein Tco_0534640 [Tanacetum coccineum]
MLQRQVQSTESHKYEDKQEQNRQTTTSDRSGRCIAHNHINTKMNESRTGRQQTSRQTADSDSRQQIQTHIRHQIQSYNNKLRQTSADLFSSSRRRTDIF